MQLGVKRRSAQEPVHLHDLAVPLQDECPSDRLAAHLIRTVVLRQHRMLRLSPVMACPLEHPTGIRPLHIAHQISPLSLLPHQG